MDELAEWVNPEYLSPSMVDQCATAFTDNGSTIQLHRFLKVCLCVCPWGRAHLKQQANLCAIRTNSIANIGPICGIKKHIGPLLKKCVTVNGSRSGKYPHIPTITRTDG